MIVERVAYGIARGIKKANPEQTAKKSVLYFGLKIIVNATAIIILTLFISYLMGVLFQSIEILALFSIVRLISGGYHLKSSDVCVLVSAALLVVTAHLINAELFASNEAIITVSLINLVLYGIFAPSNLNVKIRFSSQLKLFLKLLCLLLIVFNLIYLKSTLVIYAMLLQGLTIPFKNRTMDK